ncbi:MAG TPA: PPK2 family polyphosphate kinase [Fimbriimonadaceae bacterium]|nr:PPK2 family polyphosphate kinase [Fimbriimonadaceae bacterium]
MPYAWIVEPGSKVKLSDYDPDHIEGLDKEQGRAKLAKLATEIEELQELMYAAKQTALLCVFQGRDTAGKDGAINKVLSYTNVQGCRVNYFKVPTPEEASHDFLWRVHKLTPGVGGITLFNRSHYEDVVVVRVHDLAPKEVWKDRYDEINSFEALLARSNTVILKFYLHIGKDEQRERLLDREKDDTKAWKLSVGDWKERELWDDYTEAYEDALTKCSTEHAPWRIVPANHKWFRDLAVAEAIRDALKPHRKEWMKHLEEIGRNAKAELAAYRKGSEL